MTHRPPTRHDIGRMVEVSNNGEQWQSGPLFSMSLGRQGNYYQIDAIQVFLFCRVTVTSPDPQAELAIAADWLAQQGLDEAARVVMEAMEKQEAERVR